MRCNPKSGVIEDISMNKKMMKMKNIEKLYFFVGISLLIPTILLVGVIIGYLIGIVNQGIRFIFGCTCGIWIPFHFRTHMPKFLTVQTLQFNFQWFR